MNKEVYYKFFFTTVAFTTNQLDDWNLKFPKDSGPNSG